MTGEQHWWQTFFEGPPMEVWRRLVPQAQTQAEAELLAGELNQRQAPDTTSAAAASSSRRA